MRKIVLEGRYLTDRETAHEYLKKTLHLPEYYGKNLDALYDCLTDLQDLEIEIKMQEEENLYFEKILRVFKAAARTNDSLKVKLDKR